MKNLLLLLALAISCSAVAQEDEIAKFIKKHPEKSSIYLKLNGAVTLDINSDRVMPLASSVKIIVAIEYAHQVAQKLIDPHTLVDTAILHKYYIPNTDGGAQPQWLKQMSSDKRFVDQSISLEEIAKGMINYSCNANTEYLLDLLTLEKVNARLKQLGLTKHQNLYYFISALGVINNKSKNELEKIPLEEYINTANQVHEKLKHDKNYKSTITNLSLGAQKVWSDRLVGATTQEYVSILEKINSHTYFDSTVQQHIDIVLGGIMSRPSSKKWLKHGGFKGGSTAFVLTQNIYLTKLDGETLELSYFFNDLSIVESQKLQKNMGKFEVSMLLNKDGARGKIIKLLNND